MNNNAENNVIDIYPYFQGGSYTKETCQCGCGMLLEDMKKSDYYDYENNLEEE